MPRLTLTIPEICILSFTLNTVIGCLDVDDSLSESYGEKTYSDGGNFVFSLSEKEYKLLLKVKDKI